jgi:hypothetical protein
MYIWNKQIKSNKDGLITFEDWTVVKHTLRALEYLITDEPKDPSRLQAIACEEISKDIIAVLLMHDTRVDDLNYIFAITQWVVDEQRWKFLCKATWLYSNIQKELETIPEDKRKLEELNLLSKSIRDIRLSHYTNF